MTTIYGYWEGNSKAGLVSYPYRPIITAEFSHLKAGVRRHLEFLVDTGADHTVIVPEAQKKIEIHDSDLSPVPTKAKTLGGEVEFQFLRECTLTFSSVNKAEGEVLPVSDLTLYFSPKPIAKKKSPLPLSGEGHIPCILGRDVLQGFSMGYSEKNGILFLTTKHAVYKDSCKQGKFWPIR